METKKMRCFDITNSAELQLAYRSNHGAILYREKEDIEKPWVVASKSKYSLEDINDSMSAFDLKFVPHYKDQVEYIGIKNNILKFYDKNDHSLKDIVFIYNDNQLQTEEEPFQYFEAVDYKNPDWSNLCLTLYQLELDEIYGPEDNEAIASEIFFCRKVLDYYNFPNWLTINDDFRKAYMSTIQDIYPKLNDKNFYQDFPDGGKIKMFNQEGKQILTINDIYLNIDSQNQEQSLTR